MPVCYGCCSGLIARGTIQTQWFQPRSVHDVRWSSVACRHQSLQNCAPADCQRFTTSDLYITW